MSWYLLLVLLVGIQVCVAQNSSTLQAIINDLNALNATQMVNLLNSGDITFQQPLTSSSPRTLFVPQNDAFTNATIGDATATLLYHLISGGMFTVDKLGTGANHSILTTFLTGHSRTFLEGNKPAVIACGNPKGDGQIEVYNQQASTLVTQTKVNTELNIVYHVLNRIIDFPFNYNQWISTIGTSWHSVAQGSGNSDDKIGAMLGYTFFVFDDASYQSDLSAHLANESALQIFNNHVILGQTMWYNLFETQTWTTASGNNLTFTLDKNSLDYTVSIGQSAALIVRSDLTTDNGVIHQLQGTLWDINPTTTIATTVSGTATGTDTSAPSATGSSASSSGATSSSHSLSGGAIAGIVIGVIVFLLLLLVALLLWRRRQRHVQHDMDEKDVSPYTPRPFTAGRPLSPYTETSFGAGQPTPYPLSPSVDTRDDTSTTSPSFVAAATRAGKRPPPLSPGSTEQPSHYPNEPVPTAPFDHTQIPDQMVDHLLERIAARIDVNDSGIEPPTYRG